MFDLIHQPCECVVRGRLELGPPCGGGPARPRNRSGSQFRFYFLQRDPPPRPLLPPPPCSLPLGTLRPGRSAAAGVALAAPCIAASDEGSPYQPVDRVVAGLWRGGCETPHGAGASGPQRDTPPPTPPWANGAWRGRGGGARRSAIIWAQPRHPDGAWPVGITTVVG